MARANDWLSAIPSPYTRKTYKAGIKKFEEFYGKGIEILIGKSGEETGRIIERARLIFLSSFLTKNSDKSNIHHLALCYLSVDSGNILLVR